MRWRRTTGSGSNATSAFLSTGEPVAHRRHPAQENLSSLFVATRPANVSEMLAWSSRRTFTHSTPLFRMISLARLKRCTQTSSDGGSADTEHMALTVTPARPCAPPVVTTLTVQAA